LPCVFIHFLTYCLNTNFLFFSFDPHFNAITGLNGSGKSNILDSICFVLGITNLSQVRAGSLSELVYKQGQAGITKASVTIIFNNEDESTSPVGYEQCPEVTVTRQVLLGGKSKYLINGRNSPAGQVQNLFHSVQLNVNNPHFLIMQGRITKVLNMKPNEILGMVEEAAGTRMYETKRVAAIKTIDKKQAKVDELNSVLSEEITPTLERLRGEKQNYLKWSKNNADMERIERFVIASNFMKAQRALDSNVEGFSEMEEKVKMLEEEAESYQHQIDELSEVAEKISSKLKGEFHESHSKLKKEEEKLSKQLVKTTTVWQNSIQLTKQAESELKDATDAVSEARAALSEKEKQIESESKSIEDIIVAKNEAQNKLEQLTSTFQNMSAGLSSSEGDDGMTLPDQIAKAHSDSKAAEAKVKQATMKISHLNKELEVRTLLLASLSFVSTAKSLCFPMQSVEKQMRVEQKNAELLNKKRHLAVSKTKAIRSSIDKLKFNQNEYNALDQEKDSLSSSVVELTGFVETLTAQLESRLAFNYTDPVRGFDRSKVKGIVAKLITVHHADHSTAIEVVAGGKLFQVVVDEAITGKALLDRGKLQRRVTIIPLDKIQPRRVTGAAIAKAQEIAANQNANAWPAIELVGFDGEVCAAMEYVFGASIVVDNGKAANLICDTTKTRTVTLDGDVYDPSGTISGGSKSNLGNTLSDLSRLSQNTHQLAADKQRLGIISNDVANMKNQAVQFEKLSRELMLAEAELDSVQKHLSQTSYGVLEEQYETMSKELEESNIEYVSMQKEQKEKWDLYHQLKDREVELTQNREDRLGHIENQVKEAKSVATEAAKNARDAESRKETLVLELNSLKVDVQSAEEGVASTESAVRMALEVETTKEITVGEVKATWDEAKAALQRFEDKLSGCSSELADIAFEKTDLFKKAEKCTLESKTLSVNIARLRKEKQGAEKLVVNLMKNHPWIESEKSAFGVAGGDYDFKATDSDKMTHQLQTLKGEQESLVRKSHDEWLISCAFLAISIFICWNPSTEQEDQQESHGDD
jgi:structural maintenance of chromosome 2